jgi:hypothetical protein
MGDGRSAYSVLDNKGPDAAGSLPGAAVALRTALGG